MDATDRGWQAVSGDGRRAEQQRGDQPGEHGHDLAEAGGCQPEHGSVGVSWAQFEPVEGQYNYVQLDGVIAKAARTMHVS